MQFLQSFLALLTVLGNMHQRLLGRNAWIEEVDLVLQPLNSTQRVALEDLLEEIEQQAEGYPPHGGHERHRRALDHPIDALAHLLGAGVAVDIQFSQADSQADEGAKHTKRHQEARCRRQQAASSQTTGEGSRVEEMLSI
ncbi:hypothetical protein D9M69_620950 [compost metagenome]